jgi:hypothetical protein
MHIAPRQGVPDIERQSNKRGPPGNGYRDQRSDDKLCSAALVSLEIADRIVPVVFATATHAATAELIDGDRDVATRPLDI